MIDFNLLCNILSPGIFVILAGGLITGYDTATLIVIGVIGYSLVFLMRRLAKRQRKQVPRFLLPKFDSKGDPHAKAI